MILVLFCHDFVIIFFAPVESFEKLEHEFQWFLINFLMNFLIEILTGLNFSCGKAFLPS